MSLFCQITNCCSKLQKNSWNVSYHTRRKAPILVDHVNEGEWDGEDKDKDKDKTKTKTKTNSYHPRREAPIFVDQVDEGERDGEEAKEEVGQGQVGNEDVARRGRHLNIEHQHLNICLK